MQCFAVFKVVQSVGMLYGVRNSLLGDVKEPATSVHLSCLKTSFNELLGLCEGEQFRFARACIERALLSIRLHPTSSVMQDQARVMIDNVNRAVEDVLKECVFMHIPPDRARFHSGAPELIEGLWQRENINPAIQKAFPSALFDLQAAYDCYATNNHTACVFHLMRAAEHGLRGLTVAVGVGAPKVALEYQQWENLIQQVEKHSKAIDSWPPGARSNARAFFHGVIADFRAFKDDIRNVMMHTRSRGNYDEHQARHQIERVVRCLERLAELQVAEGRQGTILNPSLFN